MSAENSRWYLRIGPDETYFDPCQVKAGFHVSLARIDKGALEWKRKLTPIRQELEERLAKVIGSAYTARQVKFKVPDFINIVLNAGDSRSAIGATVGQSLPNFGPVAAESRGRTVVMANLYTDPDSKADGKKKAELLLSKTTLEYYDETSRSHLLDVVLHEATHNFGPYGSTKVGGKLPEEVFGGRMDAILEELKAQTGSLYLPLVLQEKGLITAKEARQLWVSAILWAFGQVSQGLVTSTGKPRTYPQLAAVQLGELTRAGALTFDAGAGPDSGRFTLVWDKVPAAVTALMKEVGRIKASGDVEAAKTLVGAHTSTEGVGRIQLDLITERVRRFSKASFVYAVVP